MGRLVLPKIFKEEFKMETIERKALTQDEMIMELLQLLKQNNMQQE